MLREGDEPIPGYVLTKFLGKGTFGEVWQARTHGGFRSALKFVDLSVSAGLKEYRGIQRVKDIRHGRLMLMTNLWMLDRHGHIIPEQLLAQFDTTGAGSQPSLRGTMAVTPVQPAMFVVAMPLADKSLLDVLDQTGGKGIPLLDLIRYMEHAAEGLDFLNEPTHDLGEGKPVAIQHCDIKPANIMLMGNAAVICDFGLARILGGENVQRTVSGMAGTYPYMAPESIDSPTAAGEPLPSHASDQYSLAVTYVELRTGRLPFREADLSSHVAILRAHCEGRLDLSALPEGERKVIARATAVNPADRFPSNMKMVRQLRRAVRAELEKATGQAADGSGDYGGMALPENPSPATRAKAETNRIRETVAFTTDKPTPRSKRKLVGASVLLLAVAGLAAVGWWGLIHNAKTAGTDNGSQHTQGQTSTNGTGKNDADENGADEKGTDEQSLAARTLAEATALVERVTATLVSLTPKEGDLETARNELKQALALVGESDDPGAQTLRRGIHLQLARIEARQQQWDPMFASLRQVADSSQPEQYAKLAPRDRALVRALEALGNAKSDAKEVLSRLALLAEADANADQLDPWEAGEIGGLKDDTRRQIERLLPLKPPYAEMCDRVWRGGFMLESLLAQATGLLAEKKYDESLAKLDEAGKHARGKATDRIVVLRALLSLHDPTMIPSKVIEKFCQALPKGSVDEQSKLTAALLNRVEQDAALKAKLLDVLAKNAVEFGPGLRERLQGAVLPKLAAAIKQHVVNERIDFGLLDRQVTAFQQAGGKDAIVDVVEVERKVEGSNGNIDEKVAMQKVQICVDRLTGEKDVLFADYVYYVRAVLRYRSELEPDFNGAVEDVERALNSSPASGALKAAERRRLLEEILLTAAERLRAGTDDELRSPFDTAESAQRAAKYLNRARELSSSPSPVLLAKLALATEHAGKPDWSEVAGLCQPLVESGQAPLQVLLSYARANGELATAEHRVQAVETYQTLVNRLLAPDSPATGLETYERVIVPALAMAEQLAPKRTNVPEKLRPALASIYAAQGQLIQDDVEVELSVGRKDAAQLAYRAFESAVGLQPRAAHYVGLGRALLNRQGQDKVAELQKLQQIAAKALELEADYAGAHGIRGHALLLESRLASSVRRRAELLQQALEAYDRALAQKSNDSKARAGYLVGRSTTHVESSFLDRSNPAANGQHLDLAIRDAEEAAAIDTPRPEYSLIAWGNALEDKAYYLKQRENYELAIGKFKQAVSAAGSRGRSTVSSYFNLGRCRLRRAIDDDLGPAERASELEQASKNLNEALSGAEASAESAEIHSWICQTHLVRARKALEAKNSAVAREAYREAGLAAAEASRLGEQFAKQQWPTYCVIEAELALEQSYQAAADPKAQTALRSKALQLAGKLLAQPDAKHRAELTLRAINVQLDTTESLADRIKLVAEIGPKYFSVDSGLGPDNPEALQARASFAELQVRLSEALVQGGPQYATQAEASAKAALELLPKTVAAQSRQQQLKSRSLGILGRVNYVRYFEADQPNRKQVGEAAVRHLDQAVLLSDGIESSALWRILLANLRLDFARRMQTELEQVRRKIADLTVPADKQAQRVKEKQLVDEQRQLRASAKAGVWAVYNSKVVYPNSDSLRAKAAELLRQFDDAGP